MISLEEMLDNDCTKILSDKTKDKIAKNTADYWRYNCLDEDFSHNCKDTICTTIQDYHPESCGVEKDFCTCSLVYEIWDIIEEKYLDD